MYSAHHVQPLGDLTSQLTRGTPVTSVAGDVLSVEGERADVEVTHNEFLSSGPSPSIFA